MPRFQVCFVPTITKWVLVFWDSFWGNVAQRTKLISIEPSNQYYEYANIYIYTKWLLKYISHDIYCKSTNIRGSFIFTFFFVSLAKFAK